MRKTVEQLMRPRYKVIASFPQQSVEIGKILTGECGRVLDFSVTVHYAEHPHLFKPLRWWEDRQPEEMPEYVKDSGLDKYCKVSRYDMFGKSMRMIIGEHSWAVIERVMCFFEPATFTEYESYLNSTHKT